MSAKEKVEPKSPTKSSKEARPPATPQKDIMPGPNSWAIEASGGTGRQASPSCVRYSGSEYETPVGENPGVIPGSPVSDLCCSRFLSPPSKHFLGRVIEIWRSHIDQTHQGKQNSFKGSVKFEAQPGENSWAQGSLSRQGSQSKHSLKSPTANCGHVGQSMSSPILGGVVDKPVPPLPRPGHPQVQAVRNQSSRTVTPPIKPKVVPAVPFIPSHGKKKDKGVKDTNFLGGKKADGERKTGFRGFVAKFAGDGGSGKSQTPGKSTSNEATVPIVKVENENQHRKLYPIAEAQHDNSDHLESAPANITTHEANLDFFREFDPSFDAERKTSSTPVRLPSYNVTRRYYEENNKAPPEINEPKRGTGWEFNGLVYGDGGLAPTRQGSYGVSKKVEIKKGLPRAASHHVILDTNPEGSNGDSNEDVFVSKEKASYKNKPNLPVLGQFAPPRNDSLRQSDLESLKTDDLEEVTGHSPTSAAGVWENNSHVARALLTLYDSEDVTDFQAGRYVATV